MSVHSFPRGLVVLIKLMQLHESSNENKQFQFILLDSHTVINK